MKVQAYVIRQKRRNKRCFDRKEMNGTISVDSIIVCVENTYKSTKKLLNLIRELKLSTISGN